MRVDIPVGLQLLFGTDAAVEEDGTSGLVIEIFNDLDKVCADVVLLHGCPQSCMPNPVEGLLEVYEDIIEVLPVLEIFLTEDSQVEDLLCGTPSCSEPACSSAMIFSACGFNLYQYDIQHDFAWMTDETYCSVVQALLQVAFHGKCDDQGLGPWGWPFSWLPDLFADCRESFDYILHLLGSVLLGCCRLQLTSLS